MSNPATVGAVLYAKLVERVIPFYAEACGLVVTHAEHDHAVLESPVFQLVIVAIPETLAASIPIATPPVRRENTPIKLVFHVANIDAVRKAAANFGGELNPPEREWYLRGIKVCDGHDPEGNVVQFREHAL